ncbi:MAG: hypothetical protein CSA45_05175 [Gammaproteobacteria bacterium]|nr:MAG: hypothetical protein CSA45_05175 [Gammaproteobacteria bacterium]
MIITQLWVYPIKSCQGIALSSADLLSSGLRHDREMMIVDTSGCFVTQRSNAILAHIGVALSNDGQVTITDDDESFTFDKSYYRPASAEVWRRRVPAFDQGDDVADCLSDIIGHKVRLLATRPSDTAHADKPILFQDGQAVHVLTEFSLQHAQQMLADYDIDVRRFRPNIVIGAAAGDACKSNQFSAFMEDKWKHLQTEQVELSITKLCERCVVPTINPQTLSKEKAVYTYFKAHRLVNKKSVFGVCGYGTKLGKLAVGDKVIVK